MKTRMYTDLAEWWPLLSPVEEYAEEASLFEDAVREYGSGICRTMLELSSGGGHNAFYLKRSFEMTLVDLSEGMVRQSRALNPELPHVVGDMRTVRLDAEFDVVFVHDAISYMTTRADLKLAMTTAFAHCVPGGVALFVPDETRERFVPDTTCGGSDDGPRGFRYMEWVWDPDPEDEICVTDYAFLARDESGAVRAVHERHEHGLFPEQVWLDLIAEAGFRAQVKTVEHSELPSGYQLFVGVKETGV